jgi:hypothetical protein
MAKNVPAIKAGRRNSALDQERINTIAELADEIASLAEELGAESYDDSMDAPTADPTKAIDDLDDLDGPMTPPLEYALGGEIKAIDPSNPYRLRGLGIVFGGADLVGDTFGPDTDFGLERTLKGMPVMYDHALRGIKSKIGQVVDYEIVDEGIEIEIELDRRHKYIEHITTLLNHKALQQSSGAVGHLVIRQNGQIKRWILGEISLTPTPAEIRTTIAPTATASPKAPSMGAGDAPAGPVYILKRRNNHDNGHRL